MLPTSAHSQVLILHDIARPTRMAAITNAMKTIPWAMPKIFTPISVRGSAEYLKYIPTNSPAHVTASANAINRKRPAALRTSNAVAMAPLCLRVHPQCAVPYRGSGDAGRLGACGRQA